MNKTMSRRKVTRQKPVHLDNFRVEKDTRACLRANILTIPNGSSEEICERALNSYQILYVNDKQNGQSLNLDDNSKVNRTEGDYVTLIERFDGISNVSSATNSKDSFSDSGRGSDFKHKQNENIIPFNGVNGYRNSGDDFNEGDDVYVTLCRDSITKSGLFTEGKRNSGNTDEIDIRNDSDYLSSLDSHYVPGSNLSAKAIIEPLSPQVKYQPYLNQEPFSDTESSVSTELHRNEYLKQLKEFEHSIDGAVWKRKLWQMESKRDDVISEAGESSESIDSGGKRSHPEEEGGAEIETAVTGSDDKVSLEDIIQDFLQYFQTKRHSVKTNHGFTKEENNVPSENKDIKIAENLQDKLEDDLPPSEKENVSQVPYLGKSVNRHSLQTSENTPSPTQCEEEPPSPPPRRPIRDNSRRPRSQYGNQSSSSRNYIEKIPTDSHQYASEKTITSSRSPSIRKRDIMMRRYNSTSVLPLETPVDMNKNHLMDSRGEFTGPTNGHNDNEIKENTVVNGNETYSYSEEDPSLHPFVHMDIVGESYEARYPWQRDISTQCNLSGCRNSDSSGSVSSGSELSNYTAANNQNCSNYINSNCMNNTNGNPARRQSSDNIRKRHHVFKTRRPRSMTCLDTSNIYNNSSDMYRSDTNLNYRHGRTMSESFAQSSPSRKRMPLLLADDPGSVSDLESILENPYDGNPDRNYSVGGDSLSTEQLRRLEEIRGSSADLSRDNSDTTSSLGGQLRNVLPSPTVSPEMWGEVPEVVVNTERDDYDPGDMLRSINWNSNFLSVPRKPQRRLSSGSLHSGSDESDNEIAPPVARRGRRAAIVDTKNFGDVSPTQLSPDVSPSNSCDEGESGSNIAERLRRRRSSHDVSMNVYPGDLLVQEHHKKLIKRNTISDFYAGRNGSIGEDNKKQRQPFSLLKLMKTRSKESLHLSDVLKELKASEFKDNHLAAYKNIHWTDLIASTDKQSSITDSLNISEMERKRRESVWELFKSECVFLIDHLMVLKHCFLEPLKKCQVEGFLMYAEPSEIFSNLDELCYVSYTFCKDFIASLLKDMSATDFGSTAVLIKAFQRFSKHSKDGSVYHTYCLNYTNALSYLEKLRKNDEFCEFEKWCEQDQRCNRLQLADLLIGPMQHCTKLPLLLHNIQKYTEDIVEKTQIVESIEKVEMSLRQLEEKMKWLKNFERVQEIQRHLIWPAITDLDSRAFIPEYLKPKLSRQPCERLLACPSRQLIHEGAITLTESTKSFDAYMFLFDDILLITKVKKPNRKKQSSSDIHSTSGQPDNQMYTVHRQPIALDRLGVHDVMPPEATANGLKSAFVIVQISRFQQIIDVFTLQATSDAVKGTWISQILEAKARCRACNNTKGNSSKENEDPSPTGGVKKGRHGKSLSIDAVFL